MRFNLTFHQHLTFSPGYIPALSHYKLKDKCINLRSEQGHFKMTDAATTFSDKIMHNVIVFKVSFAAKSEVNKPFY